jgi:hypothetical protein
MPNFQSTLHSHTLRDPLKQSIYKVHKFKTAVCVHACTPPLPAWAPLCPVMAPRFFVAGQRILSATDFACWAICHDVTPGRFCRALSTFMGALRGPAGPSVHVCCVSLGAGSHVSCLSIINLSHAAYAPIASNVSTARTVGSYLKLTITRIWPQPTRIELWPLEYVTLEVLCDLNHQFGNQVHIIFAMAQ